MTTRSSEPRLSTSPISAANSPELLPPAGHYSHFVTVGGLAYLSGQLPITPEGEALSDRPFKEQARQVLGNVDAALRAADSDRDRLVSVTVYVTNIAQWGEFDELYEQWLGGHRPARAVAGVAQLHYGAALEVHAIAQVIHPEA